MADLGGPFNAMENEGDGQRDFRALPRGDYSVTVVDSDLKPTREGTGQYLEVELEVLSGEHQGRKVWDRMNLVNKNPKAVEIGKETLAALCKAVGKLSINDSQELHGIPIVAHLIVEPAKGQYAETNRVRGYYPSKGNPAIAAIQQQTVSTQGGASSGGSTPPWGNR